MPAKKNKTDAGDRRILLRLFIAGEAANSRMAIENLKQLTERSGGFHFDVEVIDVLKNPQIMIDEGIYLTPALKIMEHGDGRLIYGNLSDEKALSHLFS